MSGTDFTPPATENLKTDEIITGDAAIELYDANVKAMNQFEAEQPKPVSAVVPVVQAMPINFVDPAVGTYCLAACISKKVPAQDRQRWIDNANTSVLENNDHKAILDALKSTVARGDEIDIDDIADAVGDDVDVYGLANLTGAAKHYQKNFDQFNRSQAEILGRQVIDKYRSLAMDNPAKWMSDFVRDFEATAIHWPPASLLNPKDSPPLFRIPAQYRSPS